ncbi:hypothetical protein R1flu_020474 [Riccia fluitans]|uniref:Uncharacterized protein n=1 Tax=Riccia fluitans TaxID=41844 RepID=A0ABD1ZN86_9MARC
MQCQQSVCSNYSHRGCASVYKVIRPNILRIQEEQTLLSSIRFSINLKLNLVSKQAHVIFEREFCKCPDSSALQDCPLSDGSGA